ncbi:hypothetical protein K505DRAFT_366042 [Melanomma pulvis-pyrius CBS 109.77]|uniref:SH3 domain-containing protein n=1 Tax=Melanomma pulvis-pyrius CBS 109.77 TaxID=1314802 RepID=A0A6A6WXX9_9PLEO|nr:hypothetical protein K505DRAFT_366042 [Melanomma pulvis-pyrius CBS 109.77]
MAHQHGRAHVVRRQTQRQREDDGVRTVMSVKIVTLANTFTGDVVWITQGNSKETIKGDPIQQSSAPTSKANASSKKATATRPVESEAEETAKSSHKNTASTIMVATSSPVVTGTGAIAGLASATASAASAALSASPSSTEAAASTGMSGGAKAGLAFGILVVIGALLGAVLFVYHRKKKQIAAAKLDDEKASMRSAPPPPPPQVKPAAPSIRTQRTMSTAPRLSLRPVTQFSPTFGEHRKSGGNLLNVAAAGGAASQSRGSPSPDRPSSSWERPGAGNAANPFNDPQQRSSSPQNPFGNNAAIDSLGSSPSTPQSANHPNGYPSDFANPAPAIAAAAAMSTAPMARREVPSPPSIRETIPPSPSWTEDIPASPGPAPTGPPPVAVAGGNVNGPAPAPVVNNVYRIQLAFKPSMQDELELTAGQLVRMLHEYDDGWALCVRMDRSQQGVVPRTCLSKHPVKPRTGPPRQGPPGPRMRGPPIASPMGPGGVPQPRPLTPSSGRNSPQPPYPVNGRNSPGPRSMSPGPRSMSPGPLRMSPPNMGPPGGRARSNSNAPYAGPPRSMSPGPYGGGPQQQLPPPEMSRPRSNSASQVNARRGPAPGPSPMNPNPNMAMPMPPRKPLPGQAL